ncbi:sodium-dependent lysophosphatidylcholine symporter 1-B isoform X2 [Coregonus clupeaformis]|uniref:sodium-dependent lysophosphatidylcholine symporter 1-B isoform X2 n=1 Tax=Coregonus clupeaformis TaxID=59861 RepID=UPI001BE0DCC5|nr:sodium-dependent lysophosphatidylcholine symporter 1-B isoform X2 [Coregonus clupeaformis]
MVKGEDAEQYAAASLLPTKPISQDGIKIAKRRDDSGRLSVCSKLCYAIGGAPYQITGSALGFFLQIYLLDVAQLDPFYASIILFVGRAWDAVTDPTVGFLVSRSRWTRCGRMMPWILISTPFAVLTYFLIWYVPPVEQGKVLWYLVFYCLFQSLQTCFHVPYSALTMFISTDQKERDSATAYRMTVEVLGTVVGTAIQGQIVGGAIAPCLPGDLDVLDNGNSTLLGSDINISHISLDETKQAYLIASGVICAMYVLCAAVLFLGVREQEECGRLKTEPMSFFEGMRMVMGYGPYIKLVMGFLFTSLAFMLLEGNFALFITYTLGFRNDFQNILLVIMDRFVLFFPHARRHVAVGMKGHIFRVRGGVVVAPGNLSPSHTLHRREKGAQRGLCCPGDLSAPPWERRLGFSLRFAVPSLLYSAPSPLYLPEEDLELPWPGLATGAGDVGV